MGISPLSCLGVHLDLSQELLCLGVLSEVLQQCQTLDVVGASIGIVSRDDVYQFTVQAVVDHEIRDILGIELFIDGDDLHQDGAASDLHVPVVLSPAKVQSGNLSDQSCILQSLQGIAQVLVFAFCGVQDVLAPLEEDLLLLLAEFGSGDPLLERCAEHGSLSGDSVEEIPCKTFENFFRCILQVIGYPEVDPVVAALPADLEVLDCQILGVYGLVTVLSTYVLEDVCEFSVLIFELFVVIHLFHTPFFFRGFTPKEALERTFYVSFSRK